MHPAELAQHDRRGEEEGATTERGEPGRDERAPRERGAAGVQGSGGPAERAYDDDERAEPVDGALAERVEQEREPGESEREADVGRGVQAAPERNPVEQRHPDRDAADEQRGDARGNGLLRPRERAVAEEEQEAAEDQAGANLLPPDRILLAVAPRKREHEERCAGHEVPRGHREVRREVAHDDRERDERRSPYEVDRDQGKPDPRVATRRHRSRMTLAGRSAQVEFDPPEQIRDS